MDKAVSTAVDVAVFGSPKAIHDFHNGGPLGRSGNESHQSEASKATVTKTIQNKSKRRDATRGNLTDLSTAGI